MKKHGIYITSYSIGESTLQELIYDGAISSDVLRKSYFETNADILTDSLSRGNNMYNGLTNQEIQEFYNLMDEATLKQSQSAKDRILNMFQSKKK